MGGRRFIPDWARPEDDGALRRLLRETPMEGRIRISLEREPGFFRAAELEGGLHHTSVARNPDSGDPVAMCSRTVREVFVDGRPARVGYLSQLRIAPAWRRLGRSLTRTGFQRLAETRRDDEEAFDFTTIIEDNRTARRLLTAGLPGLPQYREIGRIRTLLLPVRRWSGRLESGVAVGSPELEDEIAACLDRFGRRHQLARRWTPERVRAAGLEMGDFVVVMKGGRVAGCGAFWDQRSFKQAVVRGYAPALARTRRILNLLGAGLPAPGSVLGSAFLSHLAIDDDDPEVFGELVSAVLFRARRAAGIRWLAIGLADRHPMIGVARRFRPREYGSVLYAVHEPGCRLVLEGRIPHTEIAIL